MTATDALLAEDARRTFAYDGGRLYWRKNPRGRQLPLSTPAGTLRPDGYYQVSIGRVFLRVHRVIFLMCHGYLPEEVDHINGDQGDNRIENLRAATRSENHRNRRRSPNKSGVKGVSWSAKERKWVARVQTNKHAVRVGAADTPEALIPALRAARIRYHGAFANHGDHLCR